MSCKCEIVKIDYENDKENDYIKIEENEDGTKFYYNKYNQRHRLIGPAIEWFNGDRSYFVNDFWYMKFFKDDNKLYFNTDIFILKLNSKYAIYIKQNIKDFIKEYNPKINLKDFKKKGISELLLWVLK